MGLSWWHILLVLLVFVLLFGTGKISGLMGDLAKGIKSFKKEMTEEGAEAEAEAEPEPGQGDRAQAREIRGEDQDRLPRQVSAGAESGLGRSALARAPRGPSHNSAARPARLAPMFDIGWSELLVIGVVAVVVVGPKELPRLMRTFGHYTGKLRAMASDFQRQFEDAVRDSEIDEVRKAMQDFHAQASDVNLRGTVDKPLMMPTPSEPATAPAAVTPPPEPTPKATPKPRAKKPKTSAAKTSAAKTASPKPASPKKLRAKKAEEGTP